MLSFTPGDAAITEPDDYLATPWKPIINKN